MLFIEVPGQALAIDPAPHMKEADLRTLVGHYGPKARITSLKTEDDDAAARAILDDHGRLVVRGGQCFKFKAEVAGVPQSAKPDGSFELVELYALPAAYREPGALVELPFEAGVTPAGKLGPARFQALDDVSLHAAVSDDDLLALLDGGVTADGKSLPAHPLELGLSDAHQDKLFAGGVVSADEHAAAVEQLGGDLGQPVSPIDSPDHEPPLH